MKILWANAAGRCAFPECRVRLSFSKEGEIAPHTIGEMAHIKGEKPNSNRYDANQNPKERNDYQNLILLCPNHHTTIDEKANEGKFSVEILQKIKADHETFISELLDEKEATNPATIAKLILSLLEENHQAWLHYGPMSDIAQKNPHDEKAYTIWRSERLSTIVPNNRRISDILNKHKAIFDNENAGKIKSFLLHSESYDRWVRDEISYHAVVRFPKQFDDLIREYADART